MIWNGCFLVFAFFFPFLPRIETDHKSLRWLFREKSKRSGPEEKLLSLVSFIEHLIVMDLSEVLRTKRINPSDAFSYLFHNWVFLLFLLGLKLLFHQKRNKFTSAFYGKVFLSFLCEGVRDAIREKLLLVSPDHVCKLSKAIWYNRWK